ncbi:hypothetical protein HHK36_032340 [Tetracentron sinense]|uniref:Uncharacterized protein n=1 Tax=Tetracentron sinense TaxID=13715 RepID=A0A834Y7G7_TETSI|nr:hypothetical protein HHK36_032340 [Tetracentron sinense]
MSTSALRLAMTPELPLAMTTEVVALLLVFMMVSTCLAGHRKALMVETDEQYQRQLVENGVEKEGEKEKNTATYPGSRVDNHHTIPRQQYNNYPSSPDSDSNGSG